MCSGFLHSLRLEAGSPVRAVARALWTRRGGSWFPVPPCLLSSPYLGWAVPPTAFFRFHVWSQVELKRSDPSSRMTFRWDFKESGATFFNYSSVTNQMLSCSVSLQPQGLWPTSFLYLRDFPGKNTGVGCHFLLNKRRAQSQALKWFLCTYISTYLTFHSVKNRDFINPKHLRENG